MEDVSHSTKTLTQKFSAAAGIAEKAIERWDNTQPGPIKAYQGGRCVGELLRIRDALEDIIAAIDQNPSGEGDGVR